MGVLHHQMFPLFIFLCHVMELCEETPISVAVDFRFFSYFHPMMVQILLWRVEKWKKEGTEKIS